ncbi:hypothetical protein sos41_36580 [Alphaproteobacteria bacterium SO-S41]|nr:hypothetical protein sos41_36580 [Alphaproteobacteria bacterium SO-S41]
MSAGFVGEVPAAPWLFGKMPAHGDFISRGLDDETVEAGDCAVAEAIAAASAHWDMQWDDVYVETPVWRFLATPGALGRDWLTGVFIPSVDAVGRQFPLLAGFAAPTLALLARPEATAAALDEAEALARSALLDALSVDTVLGGLADIAARAFGADAAAKGDPIAIFAGDMLRHMESAPWGAQSLWWVAGDTTQLKLEGALSGETLAQLFRRAPVAETFADPHPYEDAEAVLEADGAQPSAEPVAPQNDESNHDITPTPAASLDAPADAA